MKIIKNIVIFFSLMVVFTSCGDSWKNYISTEVDVEMGKSAQNQYDAIYADQILNEKENKELYRSINLIIERILKSGKVIHADDFKWELKIINDTVLNAFCLPGGKIYVYTGLINYLDNEAQLAGVLGHEIAHADKRHSIDNMAKQLGLSSVVSLVFGDGSGIIDIAQSLNSQCVINLNLTIQTFLYRVENNMCYQAQVVCCAIPGFETQLVKHKFTIKIGGIVKSLLFCRLAVV
jgi:predicted Zn-dependent protease